MMLLRLFWEFFKIGLFAVGGGMATIPFLYDLSDRTGWFTYTQLADMIAISESTPGPIGVNMATYVGYEMSGVLGSISTTLGFVAPSIIIIVIVSIFLQKFRNNRYVESAFYGLRPASSGLIASAALSVAIVALLDEADEDIISTIRESGLSRYPVYDEDINDIIGILNARDYLLDRKNDSPSGLKELLREPYFVPDTIHADDLFRDMQKGKIHMAIVIDEYGQTAGVITMEDLLEEIVGNIYDEFDSEEPPEIVQLEDNLWRISGGAYVEDIAEALDLDLPEDIDYDTLGGMIFSCLRIIPADGSQFDVQVNGLNIHVEKMEDQRVESALVSKILPEKEEEE